MSNIPHSRPTLTDDDFSLVAQTLRSGQLSAGSMVQRFETLFAQQVHVRHVAAVSSGTAALHLALIALGIGKGHEVILPTHVCTALLNAVNYVGAKPVVVDVDICGNISVAEVEKKLTKRTKVILVPHMWGRAADLDALRRLNIPFIEDCAQSLGGLYKGKPLGTLGALSVFSFYATKMMTTGEGGMVVCKNASQLKDVRDRLSYDHKQDYRVRYNYKMTDLEAALGIQQLKKISDFVFRRKRLAQIYFDRLANTKGIVLPPETQSVFYRYVIRVPNADALISSMKKAGIACERPLFCPLHRYLSLSGFPVSEQLMRESVSLPLYPSLTDQQAERIAREIRKRFDKRHLVT